MPYHRPIVIIHHGGCWDGFGAAMVARDALLEAGNPEPAIIPAFYGMTPYDLLVQGADVWVLDFSFPPDQMRWLSGASHQLVWVDHHKTAIDAMVHEVGAPMRTDEIWYTDLNRSGIRLTWDWFHNTQPRTEAPWLVDYIEDRDLWRLALPDNDAVLHWIRSHEQTIGEWEAMKRVRHASSIVEAGEHMGRYYRRLVANVAAQAFDVEIDGWEMPLATCSYDFGSDVADLLIRERDVDVAAYVLINKVGRFQYGFRSRPDFDCSVIAQRFGGGGHAQAAGCQSAQPLHTVIR